MWNGTKLATTYTNSTTITAEVPAADLVGLASVTVTVLNPSPGGGASSGITFTVGSPSAPPGVSAINVTASDLAWDPVNQVIYLSLPSTDGSNGNTVQILNPVTGLLGASASAGSEPYLLSVSKTSKYLYVSQSGTSTVQVLTLPSLTNYLTIQLGSDPFYGPFYAMDLQAAPSSDDLVAVVRGTTAYYTPQEEGGVVTYNSGNALPDVLCGWIQPGCPIDKSEGGVKDKDFLAVR
jgi:hypothetical protein